MINQHPITPPYELIEEWIKQFKGDHPIYIATRAAQWGADQELEACEQAIIDRKWFADPEFRLAELHNARRPKPPSLKEQALADFDWMVGRTLGRPEFDERSERIRRALEQLND
jgi:hypothetical protein